MRSARELETRGRGAAASPPKPGADILPRRAAGGSHGPPTAEQGVRFARAFRQIRAFGSVPGVSSDSPGSPRALSPSRTLVRMNFARYALARRPLARLPLRLAVANWARSHGATAPRATSPGALSRGHRLARKVVFRPSARDWAVRGPGFDRSTARIREVLRMAPKKDKDEVRRTPIDRWMKEETHRCGARGTQSDSVAHRAPHELPRIHACVLTPRSGRGHE